MMQIDDRSMMSNQEAQPQAWRERSFQAQRATLAGWGNLPVEACVLHEPRTLREVGTLLAWGEEQTYIMRGLGRSYGDAALNAGEGVIGSTHLNKMIAFDAAAGVLECEAGVSLAEIIDVILPRGFFLPVTPGTRFVTLGGAIAADVHGKNHHADGSIASFIESFVLHIPSGEMLPCSRAENSDVFFATLGGMGLTGAILSARLKLRRVESAYLNVIYERLKNLDEALDRFNETDPVTTYSVAWIDCLATGESLGRSVLMRGEHVKAGELPMAMQRERFKRSPLKPRLAVPIHMPGFALNSFTVGAFNSMFYRRQRDRQAIVHYEPFFYPLDKIAHWNRLYGKRGFVQYQCVFPMATSRQGMHELLQLLAHSKQASFLAVLKSFGAESGGMLSFPMPGHTLALDLPNTGESLRTLVASMDDIVLRFGGRVYLAKDALLSPAAIEEMYPRIDEFRAVCERLDPEGRISSSLARRLMIRQENT